MCSLQDIVIEIKLGRKNSVQGPVLLKLLFVCLKTMSLSVKAKQSAHCDSHCVPLKVSVVCSCHFRSGNLVMSKIRVIVYVV